MAKTAFSATKHDKSTLNSGNQYTKDDQMSIEALNNTIENSLYAVERADTAVTSSNSAVSTANSANTKATNAVNTANTASTTANDAKTKSESALATANTALSNSTEAVTTANSTISIANSANTKAENAVTTANSANTKAENAVSTSDEAKRIAQDALNSATEGVGSQVTVGGEIVGIFDADTKLDKTANAVSATKAINDEYDRRIANSYISLDYHPNVIPANADLNTVTYLEVGNYICGANATVGTLKNCPVTAGFTMYVSSTVKNGEGDLIETSHMYRLRILVTYKGEIYTQSVYTTGTANVFTYDPWKRLAIANELTNYLPLTAGSNKPLSGDLYIPSGKYIRANSSAVLGHSGSALNVGNPDLSMNLRGSTISSNKIIPNEDETVDFGSSSNRWKDGYFKDSVILNSSAANRLLFRQNGNSVFDISKNGDGSCLYFWDYTNQTDILSIAKGNMYINTRANNSSTKYTFTFDNAGGFHIPSGGKLYFD